LFHFVFGELLELSQEIDRLGSRGRGGAVLRSIFGGGFVDGLVDAVNAQASTAETQKEAIA